MTQLNKMGGNIALPLTSSFGFGDPAAPADDASSGPRMIAVAGDPAGLPAPTGSFALDYTTPAIWQATDDIGTWMAVAGGPLFTPPSVFGVQTGRITFAPDTALPTGEGVGSGNASGAVYSTNGVGIDANGNGAFLQLGSSGALNDVAGCDTSIFVNPAARPRCALKIEVTSLTDVRLWVGYTTVGVAAFIVAGDAPTDPHLGVQFSTSRGDVNWQWIRSAGGVGPTLSDSGVAMALGVYYIDIDWVTSTRAICTLRDATFEILDQQTFTTFLPIPTAELRFEGGVGALLAVVKNFRYFDGPIAVRGQVAGI